MDRWVGGSLGASRQEKVRVFRGVGGWAGEGEEGGTHTSCGANSKAGARGK